MYSYAFNKSHFIIIIHFVLNISYHCFAVSLSGKNSNMCAQIHIHVQSSQWTQGKCFCFPGLLHSVSTLNSWIHTSTSSTNGSLTTSMRTSNCVFVFTHVYTQKMLDGTSVYFLSLFRIYRAVLFKGVGKGGGVIKYVAGITTF